MSGDQNGDHMSSGVVLSSGVRAALSSLANTSAAQAQAQNRLATGKKVNSALDNPTNFFTASGLNNRASDLGRLLDSIGQATKTLEAADKGIKAITKLVENAQSVTQQALASARSTASLQGTATLTASTNLVSLGFTATDTITVTTGATNATLTVGAGSTVQNLIDAINNDADVTAQASLTSDGKLLIEGTGTDGIALTATDTTDLDDIGFLTGNQTAAAGTASAARTSLASQFDALRTQINQIAQDSGYNGVNLLDSDALKVTFNETDTSSLTISGVNFSSTGLGVSASTESFQTDKSIKDAQTTLTTALNTLRSRASTFGSNLSVVQNRQDFTKGLIDTLTTGADQLVVADPNEEGAKLLALNTRAQLSGTALSLASQSDQAVLRLF